MSRRARYLCWLAVIAALVLLTRLGATHLWDEDEGYFGSAAAEMYSRGDWIVPTFNGEMFGHKPAFMYWMMMLGFRTFGTNEFAARILSTVFGGAAAFVTYRLGEKLFNARTGFLAALVLITCLMFNIISRAATPDSFLVFFSTAALLAFVCDVFRPAEQQSPMAGPDALRAGGTNSLSWGASATMYALMGLGVLVKGPIGFLFPMAVIGLFLLCQTPRTPVAEGAPRWRRWWSAIRPFGPANFFKTIWRMRPLTAIAMISLVAGPWYTAVALQTHGAFLKEFLGVHHLHRFEQSMDGHYGSFIYYPLTILIGMFPWSIFATPIGLQARHCLKRHECVPQITFLLCWAGVYVVIFSLAATKLPNYVLPAYPALALLCGMTLDQWMSDAQAAPTKWIRASLSILVLVGSCLLLIGGFGIFWEQTARRLLEKVRVCGDLQRHLAMFALLGVPVLLGGIAALRLLELRKLNAAITCMAVATVVLLVCVWGFAAPQFDQLQTLQQVVESRRFQDERVEGAVLAHWRCFRPSMVFYWKKPIRELQAVSEARQFFEQEKEGLIITTSARFPAMQASLPDDVGILERRSQFPKKGELLLIGHLEADRNASISDFHSPALPTHTDIAQGVTSHP